MNPMMAVKAYQAAQAGGLSSTSGAAGPSEAGGFADLLQGVMTEATQATRGAEQQMAAATQGKGSLIDVVTAVSSAEASLESVVAIRDQVIQAYQEIMRMPI